MVMGFDHNVRLVDNVKCASVLGFYLRGEGGLGGGMEQCRTVHKTEHMCP